MSGSDEQGSCTKTVLVCSVCGKKEEHEGDHWRAVEKSSFWSVRISNSASHMGDHTHHDVPKVDGRRVFPVGTVYGSMSTPKRASAELHKYACFRCVQKVGEVFGEKYITQDELDVETRKLQQEIDSLRLASSMEELLEMSPSKASKRLAELRVDWAKRKSLSAKPSF